MCFNMHLCASIRTFYCTFVLLHPCAWTIYFIAAILHPRAFLYSFPVHFMAFCTSNKCALPRHWTCQLYALLTRQSIDLFSLRCRHNQNNVWTPNLSIHPVACYLLRTWPWTQWLPLENRDGFRREGWRGGRVTPTRQNFLVTFDQIFVTVFLNSFFFFNVDLPTKKSWIHPWKKVCVTLQKYHQLFFISNNYCL